jgi:hypothetical protein
MVGIRNVGGGDELYHDSEEKQKLMERPCEGTSSIRKCKRDSVGASARRCRQERFFGQIEVRYGFVDQVNWPRFPHKANAIHPHNENPVVCGTPAEFTGRPSLPCKVMQVVHDGAAQVAHYKPGCRFKHSFSF